MLQSMLNDKHKQLWLKVKPCLLLLSFALTFSTSEAGVFPHKAVEIRDPYYGMVLFEAYQENYFSAAVSLLAARDQQLLTHHTAESRLLLADLYLSYGLYKEAENILQEFIDDSIAPQVRDRAWFYLGKIHFQKKLFKEAEVAFNRVGNSLNKELQEELYALKTSLFMRQGKYSRAATHLAVAMGAEENADFYYARLNLGIAHIRAGNGRQGVDVLRQLGKLETNDAEIKSLREKANLILAYMVLKRAPLVARDFLRRIRLEGPYANRALLGLAWAEIERDNYEVALVPLRELSQREHTDPAVMESMLVIANILQRMHAYPQALESYQQAISFYEKELATLTRTGQAVNADDFLRDFLVGSEKQNGGDEVGWFWEAETLANMPEAEYLFTFMAGNEFHEALKNLRDLGYLKNRLAIWAGDISAYEDMLVEREENLPIRLDTLKPEQTLKRIPYLHAIRDDLQAELERIDEEKDALALADSHEQGMLARLERIEGHTRRLDKEMDVSEYRDRYRFYKGLLTYEIEIAYPMRHSRVKKQMSSLDGLLEKTANKKSSLQNVQQHAPEQFAGYRARIGQQHSSIVDLQAKVQKLFDEQRQQLQAMSLRELDGLRAKLRDYIDSARFSLALLQDKLATEEEASDHLKKVAQ